MLAEIRSAGPGSRHRIPTPALVCDLDQLLSNISLMAQRAQMAGVNLRPHAKSHKSAWIARQQIDAGAVGIACAKLGEAEVLTERLREMGGPTRVAVLVTSPFASEQVAQRAVVLAARCDLTVVVDDVRGVDSLVTAQAEHEASLTVLCDVDVGLGRTGVLDATDAIAIAERTLASPRLCFGGVQGYGGHLQHLDGYERRRLATERSTKQLETVIVGLEQHGIAVDLRTGGGTGTAVIDMELGLLNELQPGSYVFMDREYNDALGTDPEGQFQQSLNVVTTVVSTNQSGFVTVDAGLKALATDAGNPIVVGYEDRVTFQFFGDEFGLVTNPPGGEFARGDRLSLVPPHCDPTVDRYDYIWLVSGDEVVALTAVDARGCSQ
jgi:D-serine deaminase-like pyridoxal phosphate-dependent protein